MEPFRNLNGFLTPTPDGGHMMRMPASMEDPERYEEVMILVAGELDSMRQSGSIDEPEFLKDDNLARHKLLIDAGAKEPDWHEFYFALFMYMKQYPGRFGSTHDSDVEAIKRVRMRIAWRP